MMVKKTCRKRLTAFMRTASRYNHASPDILITVPASAYTLLQVVSQSAMGDDVGFDR
jgi:hypothetical protein